MVVEEVAHHIGQKRQPRIIEFWIAATFQGMAVHTGFGGKPRPPAEHVTNRRHDHHAEEGRRAVQYESAPQGVGNTETAASEIVQHN